jgi:hypothetical protein
MNFMLNEHIEDLEYLYRRIILNPNFWDFTNNKPTSAIFKDSNGVSVDRQGEREEEAIVETFRQFPIRAIAKIQAIKCRDLQTHPIYKPLEENKYHSEIHDSAEKIQISSSKAKKLRDNIEIVYINPNNDE